MDIQSIKDKYALMETKAKLQNQLEKVEEEIKAQQQNCNCLGIAIGLLDSRTGDYEYTHECLFCGNTLDYDDTPKIVASSYLQGNQRVPFGFQTRRNAILSSLRELSLQYINNHPSCSMEELISVLETEIDKDREKNMSKKKSKRKIRI